MSEQHPEQPEAGGGVPDLSGLLSQLGQAQQQLQAAQADAETTEIEGAAGGGKVKVRVTGGMEILGVEIDPSVVDPGEVEMLEDLVLAAVRDAVEQAHELQQSAIGQVAGGLGLPGMGGDGLGGLFS